MADHEPPVFDRSSRIADIRAALDQMKNHSDASDLFVNGKDVDTLIRDCQNDTEPEAISLHTSDHADTSQNGIDEEKEKWLQLTGFYDAKFNLLLIQKQNELKDLICRQAHKSVSQSSPVLKESLHGPRERESRMANDGFCPTSRATTTIDKSARNEPPRKDEHDYSSKSVPVRPQKTLEIRQVPPKVQNELVPRPRKDDFDRLYSGRHWSKYAEPERQRSRSPALRDRIPARKSKSYFILKSFMQHPLDIALHGENIWVTSRTNERTLQEAFESYHIVGLFFTVQGHKLFKGYAELDCRPGDAPRPSWYGDLQWSNSKPFYLRWCSKRFVLFDDISKLMREICDGRDWSKIPDCQRLTVKQGDNLMYAIHGTYRDRDLMDFDHDRGDRSRRYAKSGRIL